MEDADLRGAWPERLGCEPLDGGESGEFRGVRWRYGRAGLQWVARLPHAAAAEAVAGDLPRDYRRGDLAALPAERQH